jgi:hypothetical protein
MTEEKDPNFVWDPNNTTPLEVFKSGIFQTPMEFYTVAVNPGIARNLLMWNKEPVRGEEGTNRKASKIRVETYAAEILAGHWRLSPQPIIFSEEGPVMQLDGQQRLKAVLLAAQTDPDIVVPFTICINAPKDSQSVTDIGKPRTPADFMRMYGEKDPVVTSNATRMLYCVLTQQPFVSISGWRSTKISPQTEREFLAEHAALRQGVAIAKDTKMLVAAPAAAVLWYLARAEYGPMIASQFMNGLEKGLNMDGSDPRYKARELFSRRKIEKYPWDSYEQLGVLLTAFTAWMFEASIYNPAKSFSRTSIKWPSLVPAKDLPNDVKLRFVGDLPGEVFQS